MRSSASVFVVMLLVAACVQATSEELSPGELPKVDTVEAGLWMHMDRLEDQIKSSGRLVLDSELDSYVQTIVCDIEPEHCNHIRLYIVDNPYFNATMSPNGMMQIWTGLILRAESRSQLAYVIAHELSHYIKRHSLQRWIDIQNKANASTVFSLLTSAAGVGYAGYAVQLAALASILSFSRDQEREADMYASTLLLEAGYDLADAIELWESLAAEKKASAESQKQLFLSTHPGLDERIDMLKRIAGDPSRHESFGTSRLRELKSSHQDEWLGDELTRGELGESEVLFRRLRLNDLDNAILYFYTGELLRKRGDAGDYDRAVEFYLTALAKPDPPPKVHRSLGQLYIRLGQNKNAIAALNRYLTMLPEAPDRDIVKFQIEKLRVQK